MGEWLSPSIGIVPSTIIASCVISGDRRRLREPETAPRALDEANDLALALHHHEARDRRMRGTKTEHRADCPALIDPRREPRKTARQDLVAARAERRGPWPKAVRLGTRNLRKIGPSRALAANRR